MRSMTTRFLTSILRRTAIGAIVTLAASPLLAAPRQAQTPTPTAIRTSGTSEVSRLQVLVNDAAWQVQLSYRSDATERNRRREQIELTIAAWQAAARNKLNDERLAEWLRGTIRSSMPGSREALPALPEFETAWTGAIAKGPAGENLSPTKSSSDEDPFRDDPAPMEEIAQ
jgi:hypothetical protein